MEKNQQGNNPQLPGDDSSNLKIIFFRFIVTLWASIKEILKINEQIDYETTTEGIKRDVDFKGYNVYILIFSIFIASIGLNVNSAAVIIGAMLISPLMGPIIGVGLSVGINDFTLLKRSLKSWGVAAGVSLLTSTIYFLITPLKDQQPEILARTTPTLLDAFVAFFGGLAGIMAGSRKEKSNVVPGVAIATALMPPLCTAGYGLANGEFAYFLGALYLFLINSIFISIATFIVVKYLKFPLKSFVDKQRERAVKRYIYGTVIVILIPSTFIFWNMIQKSIFQNQAKAFVTEFVSFPGTDIINEKYTYTDSVSLIEVYTMGETISTEMEQNLNSKLVDYGLKRTKIKIRQAKDRTDEIAGKLTAEVRSGIIEDLYKKKEDIIEEKNSEIFRLNQEIARYQRDSIPLQQIAKELRVQYPNIRRFSYSSLVEADLFNNNLDTIPTFVISWKDEKMLMNDAQLKSWLKIRLNLDTLRIIRH